MWKLRQTQWMQDAARPGIQRFDVKDPGDAIEIPDRNAVLWRYMDLAKLLFLVSKRSLFFPALDKLGDRFEGQWSERTLSLIRDWDNLWIRDTGDLVVVEDKLNDERLEFPRQKPDWTVNETINHWNRTIRGGASRGSTFVNCWYEEVEESEAMWKLFASQQYGIAVRTTAARLIGSFTEQLPDYFGRVSYVAYDSHLMPVTELPPVFFKRNAFKHESEVRAVVAPEYRVEQAEEEHRSPGFECPIDSARLIQAIVVSPYSPAWLPDIVRSVLEKYGIDAEVEKSVLERRPPGEGLSVTILRPQAYFAFLDSKLPLRIWAISRAHAYEAAREHWRLRGADQPLEMWTESECDDGRCERPDQYERISSRHNDERQNSLDPERT